MRYWTALLVVALVVAPASSALAQQPAMPPPPLAHPFYPAAAQLTSEELRCDTLMAERQQALNRATVRPYLSDREREAVLDGMQREVDAAKMCAYNAREALLKTTLPTLELACEREANTTCVAWARQQRLLRYQVDALKIEQINCSDGLRSAQRALEQATSASAVTGSSDPSASARGGAGYGSYDALTSDRARLQFQVSRWQTCLQNTLGQILVTKAALEGRDLAAEARAAHLAAVGRLQQEALAFLRAAPQATMEAVLTSAKDLVRRRDILLAGRRPDASEAAIARAIGLLGDGAKEWEHERASEASLEPAQRERTRVAAVYAQRPNTVSRYELQSAEANVAAFQQQRDTSAGKRKAMWEEAQQLLTGTVLPGPTREAEKR